MKKDEIVIRNMNKFYGSKHALYDINLTIKCGMFGLLGRNGAGKTTLMKVLATLLNKRDGQVTVCGIPIENAKRIRSLIGYLPQEFSMYPNMTVIEAMDYLGLLSGMEKSVRRKRSYDLISQVNLTEHYNKKVRALSGGMKRRLGIAQALLHDPKVLIVDEPTAGLDPEERIRFRNLLCEVAENRIVILSTHIVGDIEATCQDVAVLNDGRIIYDGSVERLTQLAEGMVFQATVRREDLPKIKSAFTVTGMVTTADRSNIRFIAEHGAPEWAERCEPNVEDAYMLCLHRNGARNLHIGGEVR